MLGFDISIHLAHERDEIDEEPLAPSSCLFATSHLISSCGSSNHLLHTVQLTVEVLHILPETIFTVTTNDICATLFVIRPLLNHSGV